MSLLETQIDVALESHFLAGWAAIPRTEPVYWRNDGRVPPESPAAAWVRFSRVAFPKRQALLTGGDGGEEYTGQATVQVFVPRGSGNGLSRALRDAASLILQRRRITLSGGKALDLDLASWVEVGPSGAWTQGNVVCPYRVLDL